MGAKRRKTCFALVLLCGAGARKPVRTVLSLMDQFVEVIRQHPGQKQVDRAVVVAAPGKHFSFLSDADKKKSSSSSYIAVRLSLPTSSSALSQRSPRVLWRRGSARDSTLIMVSLNDSARSMSVSEVGLPVVTDR